MNVKQSLAAVYLKVAEAYYINVYSDTVNTCLLYGHASLTKKTHENHMCFTCDSHVFTCDSHVLPCDSHVISCDSHVIFLISHVIHM